MCVCCSFLLLSLSPPPSSLCEMCRDISSIVRVCVCVHASSDESRFEERNKSKQAKELMEMAATGSVQTVEGNTAESV